jgi:hypothetical protein
MTARRNNRNKRLDNRLVQQKLRYELQQNATTEAVVFQQIVIAAVEASFL